MPSRIYQNTVDFIVGFPIWRCTSTFMEVGTWEYLMFVCEIYRCVKVYYSNSVIITNFTLTFIYNCRFENVSPAYFDIEI
jgi:hypothetical protein